MSKLSNRLFLASCALTLTLLQGCAPATLVKASSLNNPPPAEAFQAFGRIDIKPVVFREGLQGHPGALTNINETIRRDLDGPLREWNKGPDNGRSLIIEPVIEQLDYKSVGNRIMVGNAAGSSGVLLRLNIRDAGGRVIASPEFFQTSIGPVPGTMWKPGDTLMLVHVANLATTYLQLNYAISVGGPTGADANSVMAK